MTRFIPSLVLVAISLLYLLIAGAVAVRRGFRDHTIRLLLLFVTVAAGSELLYALWQLLSALVLLEGLLALLPIQLVLLLAFLYFHLSRAFLRLQQTDQDWWRLGIALMVGVLLLQGVLLVVIPSDFRLGRWDVQYRHPALSILIIGWMVFIGGVALLTLRSYRPAPGPWHRNRLKYWLLGLCLLVVADGLFFAGHGLVGSTVRLAAVLIMVYAVVVHHLLDMSQMMRYILSYLIITFLTLIFYLLGFISMQYVFQEILVLNYDPLVSTLVTALVLAVLFNPLLNLVQRGVDRLILGRSYDPNLLIREYSASISNILSLNRLAVVILRMIRRAMGIQHGTLFLVHPQKDSDGQDCYHLQAVKHHGRKQSNLNPQGDLQTNGLVATYLGQERRLLTQYDLDMLPRFAQILPAERSWLDGLEMEVCVPIHAKDEWIGLLALGPKTSRRPYFDSDLTLLSTLADQTAVALQNARLVQDLVKLNKDLKQAYQALDQVNSQLKELDNLKSAFIGMITHELRSPLINIDFSMQLIERQGLSHLVPDQREQLAQLKSNIQSAKQMIDNLVNFATFLSKRGELDLTQVKVAAIVEGALFINKPAADKKQIALHLDLPPHLPPVSGDPERLIDALHHLMHNAIKFTPQGGQIWIRCRIQDDALRFEVQDTGIGIPADKLPTLWEEFAQMSDPVLRGVEGLGLGLSLVQYVAHAHHGEVFAHSEVGVGSTFGFQIPLNGQE
ncbi:MAG: GAF domain-containing sensor histidine kinase [Anaerolineae bacterium]|nr:GAF domain-containing sensor histidine kinase [Anaerolineae bacterium]